MLTSRPVRFTPENEQGTYSVRYWLNARTGLHVLGEDKVLILSESPPLASPQSSQQTSFGVPVNMFVIL
jgi:hypothetical protein